MAIQEFDNRIQLPDTVVDFDNEVGLTGQLHDLFPRPGLHPRFDHMRSFLIGLLSNQASSEEPIQFRTGTMWFNFVLQGLFLYDGLDWVSLVRFIKVSGIPFSDVFDEVLRKLAASLPVMTFSGVSTVEDVTRIPVPARVGEAIGVFGLSYQPFVYHSGLLIDPGLCSFDRVCPSVVVIDPLGAFGKERFTVIVKPLSSVGGFLSSLVVSTGEDFTGPVPFVPM